MPDALRKYLDPDVLSKLQGLELKARMIVEGYLSGWHKSPYHGFSVEFAEHRDYVPGDDLRYVDWKVYGKSDRYYLKQFDEETNFTCHLLVDTSESMAYRSDAAAWSKLEYAQHVAAALAFLVVRQQDAVGLATFDQAVGTLLRPASTAMHLSQLCAILDQAEAKGESAIGPILHELAERFKRRGVVVILSDFLDDPDAVLLGLKHFHHRRHDVLLLHIVDPAEEDFPFQEPTLFHGLEQWPDEMTDPRALRTAYQAEFQEFVRALRRGARDMRMDYQLIRTDQPMESALTKIISQRHHRR